jgi:hypothetical protein
MASVIFSSYRYNYDTAFEDNMAIEKEIGLNFVVLSFLTLK